MKNTHQYKTWQRNAVAVAVASCFVITSPVYANPIGADVVSGVVSMAQQGNALNITNSPGAIINWQGFSIGVNEATRFIQQSAASSVLNRVVGQDPSNILGALQSNGRVFLINPNGVLFGAGAQVDVAGLIVSTLNLSNADFLNGRYNFTAHAGAGGIENQGNLTALPGGQIYLVAPGINNSGLITSPQGDILLAAGTSVELVNANSPDMRVVISAPDNQTVNLGSIVTNSGRIGIYAGLINHHGIVSADTAIVGATGKITFKATTDINLEPGSVISASGAPGGVHDGGEVRIIADGKLTMRQGSEVHVDGGVDGGNGGFLELSGKQRIGLYGTFTGRAQASGYQNGSLLLDPTDITICATGACGSSGTPSPGPITPVMLGTLGVTPGQVLASDSPGATLYIDPDMATGATWSNISLAATNNISIVSAILNGDVPTGGSLTLTAGNDITIGAQIGTLSARFNHDLTLTAGNNVNINRSIYLDANTLTLAADTNMLGLGKVMIQPASLIPTPVVVDTQGDLIITGAGLQILGYNSSPSSNAAPVAVNVGGKLSIDFTGHMPNLGASGSGEMRLEAGNAFPNPGSDSDASVSLNVAGGDASNNNFITVGSLTIQGGSASACGGDCWNLGNADAILSTTNNFVITTTTGGVTVQGGTATATSGSSGVANAHANAELSAANLKIDTAGTILVQGGAANAAVTGNGAYRALTAAKAEISVTGSLEIANGSSGSASSVQVVAGNAVAYANGIGSGAPASPDAVAEANATISAGSLTLRANSLTIQGGGAHAQAGGSYSGSSFSFSGSASNRSATAEAKALLSVGTVSVLTLGDGGLSINGGSGGSSSQFTAIVSGSGGVNTALSDQSALLDVTGSGDVLLTSAGGITIQGGIAQASASGSGTNTATEHADAELTVAGLLTITNDAELTVQGGSASTSTSGTGFNSATATAAARLSAGSMTVNLNGYALLDSGGALLANAGNIVLVAVGNITLGTSAYIDAGAGNVTLAAVGNNFINNSGSATPITAARALIYSTIPTSDTLNGMTADFKRYNCTYAAGCLTVGTTIPATGNGFLYSYAPTLTVTADAQSKIYGAADPAFSYTVSGYEFGDDAVTALSGTLGRAAGENVGSYAINQGTFLSPLGYTISFTGNNLGITPASLSVIANALSKVYGSADPALTYTATGFQFGETALTGNLSRVAGEVVGLYAINQGSLAGANYTITYTGNNLGITPASLSVIANALSKVYGSADPALTYTATGFQLSDTAGTTLTGSLSRIAGEIVGLYAINQGSLAANTNYTVSYTGSNLGITAVAAPAAPVDVVQPELNTVLNGTLETVALPTLNATLLAAVEQSDAQENPLEKKPSYTCQ